MNNEPVDLDLLGVDLASDTRGDLSVDRDDYATISGVENVIAAFVRELVTPLGYIGRYVYDCEGLKALDEDYGNLAYSMLSEPLTAQWIDRMLGHIRDVADGHPRIAVASIDYNILTLDQGHVKFIIRFSISTVSREFNLVLERQEAKLIASLLGV